VVLFLPFTDRFSRWIERLLPELEPLLTRHLDASVLAVPAVALEATRRAQIETACEMFAGLRDMLGKPESGIPHRRREEIELALDRTQQFLASVPPIAEDQPMSQSRVAQLHAIDHLLRLQPSLRPSPALLRVLEQDDLVRPEWDLTRQLLDRAIAGLREPESEDWLASIERRSNELAERRRLKRPDLLRRSALGDWEPDRTLKLLDAMRWLDRIGYHAWRICNYLGGDGAPEAPARDQPQVPGLE